MANQADQAIGAHAVCNFAYMAYAIGPRAAANGLNASAAAHMAYLHFLIAFKHGCYSWGI